MVNLVRAPFRVNPHRDATSRTNVQEVLQRFGRLNVFRLAGERAPHKPLLVLLALGRWQGGLTDWITFAEVAEPLLALLVEFGPTRRTYRPEYPFFHLASDGVWEFDPLRTVLSAGQSPSAARLIAGGVRGRLARDVQAALYAVPHLASLIAQPLLEGHFPASLHDTIRGATGITENDAPASVQSPQRKRDSQFRSSVLEAYGRCCAACGFSVRLGDQLVGLEAAHIQWHAAGGPAVVANGIALCALHHHLFDRGAFSVSDEHRLIVSQRINGVVGSAGELLESLGGRQLRLPRNELLAPAPGFLRWHRRDVSWGSRPPLQ